MQYDERSGRAVLCNSGVRSFGVAKRVEILRRCQRIVDTKYGASVGAFFKGVVQRELARSLGVA